MDTCIEFRRSFFHWVTRKEHSLGRYGVESRLKVTRAENEKTVEYWLLSGVMAGNVYAEKNLAKIPPLFYQAVISVGGEYRIFRSYAFSEGDRQGATSDLFDTTDIALSNVKCTVLTGDKDVKSAVKDNKQLTGMIRYETGSGYLVSIEFPVNHVSISGQNAGKIYQVETGPVLIPDMDVEMGIEALKPAYLFFNDFCSFEALQYDWVEEGNAKTRIFSKPVVLGADITLCAY